MNDFEVCKQKALSLPLAPGVYIMRNKQGQVIYVGKAKKLKNRVTQYFQDTASHSPKTRVMVSKIADFDVIVAGSEFEALVLECSLIKQHMPRYNILLKDDKGYPYIRLDTKEEYPRITMVAKPLSDGAAYYGPFGSRSITKSLLDELNAVMKLPSCNRRFPRDIGKERPCLHHHMQQCAGWCMPGHSSAEYMDAIRQAKMLLEGNYKLVASHIQQQMLKASEELNFELAASFRDRLQTVQKLGQRQLVTAGQNADTDVIGYAETEAKACFTVLHFRDGNLVHKEYQVFALPDDRIGAVSTLIAQYYLDREIGPRKLLLPFDLPDTVLLEQFIRGKTGRNPHIYVPQRGENHKLLLLACDNAKEEAQRLTDKEAHYAGRIRLLGKMLNMEMPRRIESFDISNLGNSDIVAGMVVFVDGKPKPSEYKKFKIHGLTQADDYGSMHQAVSRRFHRYLSGDSSFDSLPDLLLIDGGASHAATAQDALLQLGLDVPVLGMVKDDRHRTRALITPSGEELRIDTEPSVFAFIGTIQEETHRFAIGYQKNLRGKRIRYSALDGIHGIGQIRKQQLLQKFKSISAISQASMVDLEQILPRNAAFAVYSHFHGDKEGE
ncbi:MAG: excinuclease ABC subunit UvrC [Ruminococcaceae bacterium]|nr:excinuclease ABC subunit UvrC [Oscillospiraceae bacterium]